jgi:hypothetical protein
MGTISNLGDLTFTGVSDSSPSAPVKHNPPEPPMEDQVQIASIPSSEQVEQLQSASPSNFQEVVADSIRKLRIAASQSTDPAEVAALSDLADRFQRLEEYGQGNDSFNATQNVAFG